MKQYKVKIGSKVVPVVWAKSMEEAIIKACVVLGRAEVKAIDHKDLLAYGSSSYWVRFSRSVALCTVETYR